jgi:hypothetical protein
MHDQPDGTLVESELLANVDEAKRSFLRKLVIGTAYAAPAVASFSLAGLSAADAQSYVSNLPG